MPSSSFKDLSRILVHHNGEFPLHRTRISGISIHAGRVGDRDMRVLLVEDDLTASRGLVTMLKAAAMVVDAVDTGEEALELVRLYDYDVVLLDLVLPDMEGYEVVRRLRAGRVETPVMILSGLARPQAKGKGFGMGADDFITKPFDGQELVARIQAVVRRTKGFAQPSLSVGPLTLNLGSREVSVAGAPVHLTGKEYAILELLTLRKGLVLTKEAFLNHLYGGMDEPEVKIIDVFICKLRKKLAQAGADNLIGTVWGRGYVLREPNPVVGRVPVTTALAAQAA